MLVKGKPRSSGRDQRWRRHFDFRIRLAEGLSWNIARNQRQGRQGHYWPVSFQLKEKLVGYRDQCAKDKGLFYGSCSVPGTWRTEPAHVGGSQLLSNVLSTQSAGYGSVFTKARDRWEPCCHRIYVLVRKAGSTKDCPAAVGQWILKLKHDEETELGLAWLLDTFKGGLERWLGGNLFLKIYLFMYSCVLCIWMLCLHAQQKRQSDPDPIIDSCEPPCDFWKLNSGSLEEQPVLLAIEPSLQPG